MTLTILGIIGSLLTLVLFIVKRRAARKDDPKEQLKDAYSEIDQAIYKGVDGVRDINRMVADFERLQDASNTSSGGQGDTVRWNQLHSATRSNADPPPQPGEGVD